MVTSFGDNNWPSGPGVWVCSPTKLRKNKTFNKRKNRALLTFRRLQKHYEILSNNVLRKNITRKQFRVNLVPRVSHLTLPSLAPGGGKMRDPGNEVGSE